MKKKGYTLKELFTRLLPKQWWDVEGEVSLDDTRLCGLVYHTGLALIKLANMHSYYHMDPHLGNFMFEIPSKTETILRKARAKWSKHKDAFLSLLTLGPEQLKVAFGLDTCMMIDFGMSNTTGPEDLDKYKSSFTKLRKLQPK